MIILESFQVKKLVVGFFSSTIYQLISHFQGFVCLQPATDSLLKDFILLSGLLFIVACAKAPPAPYCVVHQFTEDADEVEPVEAVIPSSAMYSQKPAPAPVAEETVVYEPEYPANLYCTRRRYAMGYLNGMFLRDPWFWPEIWFKNPQVENPHLIYPGDTLAIVYVGGERKVQLQARGADGSVLARGADGSAPSQTAGGLKVVKVNPRLRTQVDRRHYSVYPD